MLISILISTVSLSFCCSYREYHTWQGGYKTQRYSSILLVRDIIIVLSFIFPLSSVVCTVITPGRERLTVTLTLTLEMKFSITNDQVV